MTAALLATAYGDVTRVVSDLDDDGLRTPSRCAGWSVVDVLFHLMLDAQRALMALATPTDETPDVDRVSYWAPHKPGAPWAAEHERYVRASVAAYGKPQSVVRHWSDTSAAAVRLATRTDPAQRIGTQGHVLTVADLLSTLVVEAVIHHLDITVGHPHAPAPAATTLAHTREVFDAILGRSAPAALSDVDYALVAGGRESLPAAVAAVLGDAAARFPLLG